jgi:hypothetical protein
MMTWEFEREGEVVKVDPTGPLIVRVGAATDLAVDTAIAGTGVIALFEDWLASSEQRRPGANFRAPVAKLLRTLSLLSRAPFAAGTLASICRLYSSLESGR